MNLVHILNSIEYSGAETMLAASAGDFALEGFSVTCLSTGASEGAYADVMREHGVTVDHRPYRSSPTFWWAVWRYLKAGNFDIVHVHPERATFRYMALARLAGARVVVRTVHSVFTPGGARAASRAWLRRLASRALHVEFVFISESVRDNEQSRFGTRGQLINNFVDERLFFPARDEAERAEAREAFGVLPDSFVVSTVGSCVEVKRHALLIRALECADSSIECLHAGQGPLQVAEKADAVSRGVDARMRFLGNVREMRTVYIASDCLVMPSEYEGLSLAAIEAAACEVPTVAYDVPGLRDVISNSVTGFLVADETPGGLAQALSEYVRSGDVLRSAGRAARDRVMTMYSRSEWFSQHLALYRGGPDR